MSSWCALSTDSYGNYIEWAYCGYGNSNEDNCVFPFMYGGVEYSTCTDGWCATSAYENTKEYYSYKYCNADELALGLTTFDYGAGTTVTGEDCVPMIYSGANYLKCNSDTGIILILSHFSLHKDFKSQIPTAGVLQVLTPVATTSTGPTVAMETQPVERPVCQW